MLCRVICRFIGASCVFIMNEVDSLYYANTVLHWKINLGAIDLFCY